METMEMVLSNVSGRVRDKSMENLIKGGIGSSGCRGTREKKRFGIAEASDSESMNMDVTGLGKAVMYSKMEGATFGFQKRCRVDI
jgi:hypothetical protein